MIMIYDVGRHELLLRSSKTAVPFGFPSNRKGVLPGTCSQRWPSPPLQVSFKTSLTVSVINEQASLFESGVDNNLKRNCIFLEKHKILYLQFSKLKEKKSVCCFSAGQVSSRLQSNVNKLDDDTLVG